MRVLVTGGRGFVGRATVEALAAAGHIVTVATHRTVRDLNEVTMDLRDPMAVAAVVKTGKFDAVVHLAARARVRDASSEPARCWTTNVAGSIHLIEALDRYAQVAACCPRFVFASTGAVYGSTAGRHTEATPAAPMGVYATTKRTVEVLLEQQAKTGRLAPVSLRLFGVAGAWRKTGDSDTSRIVPAAIAAAIQRDGVLRINGDGTAVRDLTHVGDVADAVVLALGASSPGLHKTYNVGTGVGVSVAQMVRAIEQVSRRQVHLRYGPAAAEPNSIVADPTLIGAELGWLPTRSSLETIVADAWEAGTNYGSASTS